MARGASLNLHAFILPAILFCTNPCLQTFCIRLQHFYVQPYLATRLTFVSVEHEIVIKNQVNEKNIHGAAKRPKSRPKANEAHNSISRSEYQPPIYLTSQSISCECICSCEGEIGATRLEVLFILVEFLDHLI